MSLDKLREMLASEAGRPGIANTALMLIELVDAEREARKRILSQLAAATKRAEELGRYSAWQATMIGIADGLLRPPSPKENEEWQRWRNRADEWRNTVRTATVETIGARLAKLERVATVAYGLYDKWARHALGRVDTWEPALFKALDALASLDDAGEVGP